MGPPCASQVRRRVGVKGTELVADESSTGPVSAVDVSPGSRPAARGVAMRLYAVLVPPVSAREPLAEVVRRSVEHTGQLDLVPAERLTLVLAGFGNVSNNDRSALDEALRRITGETPPLSLRFAGGSALERPGDQSVWARAVGDVEELAALARRIPSAVQRDGFLLDRRAFRRASRVADITPTTTVTQLQLTLDRLDDYQGEVWTADRVVLIRALVASSGGAPPFQLIDEYPLGVSRGAASAAM